MNACMSEFRIVNPTLRTFSAAEARIAHSSIRFNNLSASAQENVSFPARLEEAGRNMW